MSDINCAKCGEPWNAWAIMQGQIHDKGDMLQWECNLFRAGQGCADCEGVVPLETTVEEQMEFVTDHISKRIYNAVFDDDTAPSQIFDDSPVAWDPASVTPELLSRASVGSIANEKSIIINIAVQMVVFQGVK